MKALVFEFSTPRMAMAKLLGVLSPRAYLGRFSGLQIQEVPEPGLPADDWVVIRARYCGICGSDYKQLFLEGNRDNPMTSLITFPQILGHEVVGTIERTGPAVKNRRVGERIVLNPWLSCEPRGLKELCPSCAEGHLSRCYNFTKGVLPPGIHTGNSSKVRTVGNTSKTLTSDLIRPRFTCGPLRIMTPGGALKWCPERIPRLMMMSFRLKWISPVVKVSGGVNC